MRKLHLIFYFLLFPVLIHSQDLIITNSGKRINGEITKEDSVNIYFTTNWNQNKINTLMNRNEIRSIHYDHYQLLKNRKDSVAISEPFYRCFTVGILNGGGSMIGVDMEYKIGRSFGIQVGGGLVGVGAGVNFHLKPLIRSSFISIQYWHQGIGHSYTQSLVGPSFVFRARKLFTAQLGFGYALEKGPAWDDSIEQPEVMLTYSIGFYFPN